MTTEKVPDTFLPLPSRSPPNSAHVLLVLRASIRPCGIAPPDPRPTPFSLTFPDLPDTIQPTGYFGGTPYP